MLRRHSYSSLLVKNKISSCMRVLTSSQRHCSTSLSEQEQETTFAGHLRVHHDSLGTGRFVAAGMGKGLYDDISIVVTCDVSERIFDLKEHLLKKKNASKDSLQLFDSSDHQQKHQYRHDPHSGRPGKLQSVSKTGSLSSSNARSEITRPMCDDDEASRIPTPVCFSIYLENTNPNRHNNKSTSKSRLVSHLPPSICMIGSCLGECSLSLDGLSFVKSVRHALDRSVSSVIDRRDNYQGPQLHQGVLSECAFSTNFHTPNPVYPPRQHRLLSLRPNFNAKYSPFARYGAHFPVHTIQPELYDSIFDWCCEMGIDDAFAKDMRLIALDTVERELKNWNYIMKGEEVLEGVLKRKRKSERVY